MNSRVGNLSFKMPADGEPQFDKPYSEATARMIDEEVQAMAEKVMEWRLNFYEFFTT